MTRRPNAEGSSGEALEGALNALLHEVRNCPMPAKVQYWRQMLALNLGSILPGD